MFSTRFFFAWLLVQMSVCVLAQDAHFTSVTLFDGREHRGIILEETKDEIVLRTWVGDKKIKRHTISDIRRNLSAEERAEIMAGIDPWKDEKEWKAHDAALAGQRVETPVARTVTLRKKPARQGGDSAYRSDVFASSGTITGYMGTWAQQMSAGLDKKLSLELVDSKLEDTMDLIRSLQRARLRSWAQPICF